MKVKKRHRKFMYTQDFEHLPFKKNDMDKRLAKINPKLFAYIIHDKDKDKDGNLIRPHFHVVLEFKDGKTLSAVAKMFGDKEQYFEIWRGSINNAYAYLIHRTTQAKKKYQYDPKKVVASFDYIKKMEEITTEVSKKEKNSKEYIEEEIKKYAENDITYDELEKSIGILALAKNQRVIDQITQLREEQEHKEWVTWAQQNKIKIKVLWFFGKAGQGKTRLAELLLKYKVKEKRSKKGYVVLGSSRDYFQEYHGEHYIILNDLRPNDFEYSDLLRILDPYQYNKAGSSRYHDKALSCEVIIITSPYSPSKFYENIRGIDDHTVDTPNQLLRRVIPIHVTKEFYKKVAQRKKAQFKAFHEN